MSHQKCEVFNWLLAPLILIVGATFLVEFNEVYILIVYTFFVGVVHLDYGVGVVCCIICLFSIPAQIIVQSNVYISVTCQSNIYDLYIYSIIG